jgi:hypothetical protein
LESGVSENVVGLETAQERRKKRMERLVEGILEEVRDGEIKEIVAVLVYEVEDVTMVCGQQDGEDMDLFHAAGILQYGVHVATAAATTDFVNED